VGTQKTATEAPRSTPTPAPRKKKQEGEWTTVSYAQKLKEKFPARHETLVRIEGQDEAETKRTLSGLNIQEIGGPLAQVVSRKDGSLLLGSQGEEQKKSLEETLRKKQGVKVTQVEKLNPTITLTGLGREWKPEEVVLDIWEKNEWIRMERTREQFTAEVKVLSKRVCKDPNKQNVVLTMDAKTQEECLKRKKAVVGLTFWMEEKFEVNRCFNCHGYGHQKQDCRQELTCYKCGGAHIKAEKNTCPNCVREGRKEICGVTGKPGARKGSDRPTPETWSSSKRSTVTCRHGSDGPSTGEDAPTRLQRWSGQWSSRVKGETSRSQTCMPPPPPPKGSLEGTLAVLENLLASRRGKPTIIAGDLNGRYPAFGGEEEEARGRQIIDLVGAANLLVENDRDSTPTFETANEKS
jgi:hypothetical protein